MKNKRLLKLSLFINALFLIVAAFLFFKLGGIVYVENKVKDLLQSEEASINPRVEIRNDSLELLGDNEKDIVFVGDSHVNYFEWSEYFNNIQIANRGIGSDTTQGLLNRVDSILKLEPEKIFIMIGINDIQQGVKVNEIIGNYTQLIEEITEDNPNAKIYIHSVLPVSKELYEQFNLTSSNPINKKVQELNDNLIELKGIEYIDLSNVFGDELPPEYSVDGIHLNEKGYKKWIDTIDEYVQ